MTLKNILVPLDGSQLAETVLPLAAMIANLSHCALNMIPCHRAESS